jgi:myo-inositol 2-dehydrogenase/D-chiro-inositol 1-dehydrogenase
MTRLRFGIIGAGRWAEVHREALGAVGAELVAVACASEATRARVERAWGVEASTDLQAFLARGLDAVIVASPNYLHAEHGMAALEAGAHVLVEKPMALTVADCQRLLAAAERAGRVLAVGLELRVFTLFARVKQLLDEGAIGEPLHLKLDLWRRPYRGGVGGWKADAAKVGSSILEEPVHYLDLARWYLGEAASLEAWANSRPGHEGAWENLDVRLSYESGAQALVTRSIAAFGHTVTLQLVGGEGSLWASWRGALDLDRSPEVGLWLHNSGDRDAPAEHIEIPRETGHAFDVPKQTAAFIAAIREGARPPADGMDGLKSVELCLAVERALGAGAPQQLADR